MAERADERVEKVAEWLWRRRFPTLPWPEPGGYLAHAIETRRSARELLALLDPAPTDQGAEGLVRVELTLQQAKALAEMSMWDAAGCRCFRCQACHAVEAALADEGETDV